MLRVRDELEFFPFFELGEGVVADGIGAGLVEEADGFGVEDAGRLSELLLGMNGGGREQGEREKKSEAAHGHPPREKSRRWMAVGRRRLDSRV